MNDYKPYSSSWTRYRELKTVLYSYLEDAETGPNEIFEDIQDVLNEWVNSYSSRAERGKELKNYFQ